MNLKTRQGTDFMRKL